MNTENLPLDMFMWQSFCYVLKVRLEGISKYVVNWTMRAGDLVMDKDREVMHNLKTLYIIDEVRLFPITEGTKCSECLKGEHRFFEI